MNSGLKYAVVSVCVFFTGCVNWSKPINTQDIPAPNDSYMYGRFHIAPPEAFLGFNGYQTIGMIFSCSDGKEYTIRFNRSPIVQVIKLSPSTCSFSQVIFTNADGVELDRNEASGGIFSGLDFESGTAYYLGDFYGTAGISHGYNRTNYVWKIESMKDEFTKTTMEFKEIYPNFNEVETHNLIRNE